MKEGLRAKEKLSGTRLMARSFVCVKKIVVLAAAHSLPSFFGADGGEAPAQAKNCQRSLVNLFPRIDFGLDCWGLQKGQNENNIVLKINFS